MGHIGRIVSLPSCYKDEIVRFTGILKMILLGLHKVAVGSSQNNPRCEGL